MQSRFGMRGLVQFLYTHNPFYLISACLVLYGLRVTFRVEAGELVNSWALLSSICVYCLLLAVTGFLIIRLGRVWDDARSILLILLLLIVAMSISFDEIVNLDLVGGVGILIFGLCFSAGLSEFLIRGMRIRFPTLFRMPYYGILTLFFVYPLWCSYEITGLPTNGTIPWRVFWFPTIAAGIFLLLLPAIRQGKRFAAKNGTPWRWPLYPWAIFAALAFAVCVRSYVLSIAYLPASGMTSSFGWYSLIPFLMTLLVLLLEMGIVEKRRRLTQTVLAVAPLLLLLAIPITPDQRSYAYNSFFHRFVEVIGSPMFWTTVGLLAYYSYAWVRRQRQAIAGMLMSLGLLTVVDQQTIELDDISALQAWPFLVLALVQGWMSVTRKSSRFATGSLACGMAFLLIEYGATRFTAYYGFYPAHIALTGILVIGFAFNDPVAAVMRVVGAFGLPAISIPVFLFPDVSPLTDIASLIHLESAMVFAFVCWRQWHEWAFLGSAGVDLIFMIGFATRHYYTELDTTVLGPGAAPLMWGLLSFLLATIISTLKAGFLKDSLRDLLKPANGNS